MKILVLGYLGYKSNKLDGQTIKTRNVLELLQERCKDEIHYFDTEEFKYNKCSFLYLIKELFHCNLLIYLPAHGNLKFLFPFFYLLSIIFRYKIIYIVIGGWLSEFINTLPIHRFMLRRIKYICVETSYMKNDLTQRYDFNNVEILPNFRNIQLSFKVPKIEDNRFKIVFMARIQRQKGLDYIKCLANYIQEHDLNKYFTIDFYGQIDSKDNIYFYENILIYDFINYKGTLLPKQIHNTLAAYDVLILPTHYYTEGFPGSILDAYYAGIPVIVTKWKYAHEFIDPGKTGFIIPFENSEQQLIDSIMLLKDDKNLLFKMKEKAKQKGLEYSSDIIWKRIHKYMTTQ